jgi:biofilm protein TabA
VSNKTLPAVEGDLAHWRTTRGIQGLESVFEYLERTDLRALPMGRTVIEGEDVFALVSEAPSREPSEARFEAHRRYLDVQCAIDGQEAIGLAPYASLTATERYDETKDIEFLAAPPSCAWVELKAGRFAVFAPEDGHQPGCHLDGPHKVRKVVVKVSVAYRDRHLAKGSGRR